MSKWAIILLVASAICELSPVYRAVKDRPYKSFAAESTTVVLFVVGIYLAFGALIVAK
ncbi:MAG: hypothetical protein Q7R60_04400 [bacterium]|nr:hypothetical protein [bacterium]